MSEVTLPETLAPEVARVLELVRRADNTPYHQMSAQEARAVHEERATVLDMLPDTVEHVVDLEIPGPAAVMQARAYAAHSPGPTPLPVLLWLHGGGHTVGSVDGYDPICRRLAARSGALVISLDYRLAPEHKFPAAVEDAFAALEWIMAHAGDLGGDPHRVAVAGDSAGGNLAAVCALLARDRGLSPLRGQLLVYPAVCDRLDRDSHRDFAQGFLLDVASIRWFQDQYLGSESQRQDWRFAPLRASRHDGLPRALVMVAGHDPLRDEGIAYARALEQAGTHAELVNHEGMVHAFWNMGGALKETHRSIDRAAAFLTEIFEG